MKGFISVAVLATIIAVTVVFGGGVYGAQKYQQITKENEQIKLELDQQKDQEIVRLQDELDQYEESGPEDWALPEKTEPTESITKPSAQTPTLAVKQKEIIPVIEAPVKEIIPVKTARLLTQKDKDIYVNSAQEVITYVSDAIDALDNRMSNIKKSNYRKEYNKTEPIIIEAIKIYESDKKMAEIIISATKSADENDYIALNSAYGVFIDSARETINNTEYIFTSIDDLIKQSQEIIKLVIELEVIDEFIIKNGGSPSGSSLPTGYSSGVDDARKKADDVLSSLVKKYDDEEKVNNYLIGIVVIY
jgi:hypothetical protein